MDPSPVTVYVVQNQHRQDHPSGELVPKFDLKPAEEWGEIKYLLSPTARPFQSAHCIGVLHRELARFTSKDHLLLIGNPALIGFAVAIAQMQTGGLVKLLQWDGRAGAYREIIADLKPV